MNFFVHRRWKKIVQRSLHESRHARHMRLDIAEPADIQAVEAAEQMVLDALGRREEAELDQALEVLGQRVGKIYPARPHASLREHVEIVVVALGVAMAFRTYFIQPFKIPTGSMQPTLYGITVDGSHAKTLLDVFPLSFAKRLTGGERYVEVTAPASGRMVYVGMAEDVWQVLGERGRTPFLALRRVAAWLRGNTPPGPVAVYLIGGSVQGNRLVGGTPCFVHSDMRLQAREGDMITKGQLVASGLVRSGDHIFVNRMAYNFRRPTRGDIFVFSTKDLKYPNVRTDNYYIKRMVGLPSEQISLAPPYLLVNGEKVTEPYAFRRLVEATDRGYNGYIFPDSRIDTALGREKPPLQLGPTQYLPMGDNTRSSLDGRYFGPVDRTRIIGPAFVVYWPFGPRWGRVQ